MSSIELLIKGKEKDLFRHVDTSKRHIELVVEQLRDEIEKITHRW